MTDVLAAEDESRVCLNCGRTMSQIWWKTRQRPGEWSDADAVMVHVDPRTGDVRYPGRHDAKLKEGYERLYLRNLQAVDKFERQHHVMNQRMHYDRNGRDPQDWNVGSH